MPVVAGVFEPRWALTAAEATVDYVGLHEHILERRLATERHVLPAVNRLAAAAASTPPILPLAALEDLAARLARSLAVTVRFGVREARREISALRATRVEARHLPDVGADARSAQEGEEGVIRVTRRRAQVAATVVAEAARRAADSPDADIATVTVAAQRAAHNVVLELVGEALNLGRTAGALSLPEPPTFALRSEQLDRRTCDACERVHGEIVQVDSPDYYSILPPAFCFGGGRCRGVMVFGDGIRDVRG
jgi:hypothetical protein